MTFEQVAAFVLTLPGVTVGAQWNNRTWLVNGKGFAWQRPFSKADLKRFGDATPPEGEILAIRVESLDAKEALLAIGPAGFFTIPHFDGYPGILVALRKARVAEVRAALRDAHRAASAGPAPKPRGGSRRRAART